MRKEVEEEILERLSKLDNKINELDDKIEEILSMVVIMFRGVDVEGKEFWKFWKWG